MGIKENKSMKLKSGQEGERVVKINILARLIKKIIKIRKIEVTVQTVWTLKK